MTLSKLSKEQAKNYFKLIENDKREFINRAYHTELASYAQIAQIVGTYPNKIRRDAKILGCDKPRDKSQAQSIALKSGRHKHPTKGTKRSEDTKFKISESVAKSWDNLTVEERQERSDIGKKQWDNMSREEKINFKNAAGKAIREAAKSGSKLERYIHSQLIKHGYEVEFHKEHFIVNERLQIDLFLPKMKIAIEVDGPSHFSPIWGIKTLKRNQRADNEKTGLLLSRGLVFIRIQQTKSLSQKYKRDVLTRLLTVLENIKKKFPERTNRYIILED